MAYLLDQADLLKRAGANLFRAYFSWLQIPQLDLSTVFPFHNYVILMSDNETSLSSDSY